MKMNIVRPRSGIYVFIYVCPNWFSPYWIYSLKSVISLYYAIFFVSNLFHRTVTITSKVKVDMFVVAQDGHFESQQSYPNRISPSPTYSVRFSTRISSWALIPQRLSCLLSYIVVFISYMKSCNVILFN